MNKEVVALSSIILILLAIFIYSWKTTGGSYYWKDKDTGICYHHTGWLENATNATVPCEKLGDVEVRVK